MYQPSVIQKADELISTLHDIEFFKDHEIENTEFAKKYFYDFFTQKFIEGTLNDEFAFSDDEMEKCLKEIIVGSVLYELKNKGYVNSYGDDNMDEVFFLTEDGKEYLKNIQKDDLI